MMDNILNFEVNAVRLQKAVLCAGCDVISDSPHDACLVCGSRSLLPLCRVLGTLTTTSVPAASKVPNNVPEPLPRLLVLRSPKPHRSRQRSRV